MRKESNKSKIRFSDRAGVVRDVDSRVTTAVILVGYRPVLGGVRLRINDFAGDRIRKFVDVIGADW